MKKILVFTQIREGKVEENALGLINKRQEVFKESEIIAALFGYNLKDDWIQELGKHGVKKVYAVDTIELEVYLSRPYVKTMLEIIKEVQPNLVVAAGMVYGEDLIPRLAVHYGVSCAQRVVDFSLDGDEILFHTPVRDDQAMRVTKLVGEIKFATSRTGAFFVLFYIILSLEHQVGKCQALHIQYRFICLLVCQGNVRGDTVHSPAPK